MAPVVARLQRAGGNGDNCFETQLAEHPESGLLTLRGIVAAQVANSASTKSIVPRNKSSAGKIARNHIPR
jgi:hypothetical protein